jgi:hypothetical protein
MSRLLILCTLLLLSASLASAFALAEKDDKEQTTSAIELSRNLKRTVNFSGFEKDERLTLRDCLEMIQEVYGLPILVNEAAFKAEDVAEVLNANPVTNAALPKMGGTRLETVLQQLLARVPSASGATFVVRDRHVEITTVRALKKEILGDTNRPLLPLLHRHFVKRLVHEALEDIADGTGFSVMIDPRAVKRAKTTFSGRFHNTPLDTAVRLLVDMAGLKAVQIDNLFYVTTPENARALQDEQEKRRLVPTSPEKADKAPPGGAPPK